MRAAAVAFVLIVGAAIVLWFGNTSNSLVLGGLIGGLAALLISIPISLVLFSYLSRRHDEQLRAEVQEEMSQAQSQSMEYEYAESAEEVYEAEPYVLSPAQELNDRRAATGERYLPVPSRPRLPVSPTRQHPLPALSPENPGYRQRAYPAASEQPIQPGRNKIAPVRRPQPVQADRQNRYPGFPGYQTGSMRGYHQISALRTAQQEAAQRRHNEKDTEVFPTGTSKRLPAVRSNMSIVEEPYRPNGVRPARQSTPQAPNQYRPKRTVEGSSVPPGHGSGSNRALPGVGGTSSYPSTEGLSARGREGRENRDRQTDRIDGRYPPTGQFRQPPPQTGQMGRNPHVEAQPRDPDIITGSLKNPMVRRAPYMYEDDPLRQELAQQIDAYPIRRRSSRYLNEEE